MRVLLITPVTKEFGSRWISLGLGYLSGVLKANNHNTSLFDRTREFSKCHDVEVLDMRMLDTLRRFKPDVVALSTLSPAIYDAVRCASLIRKEFKGLMVAGGHHVTAMPQLTLQRIPELDGVVAGEGEYALLDVADHGDNCRSPGVMWRGRIDKKIVHHQVQNLDELPFPDFSVYDMDYYLTRNIRTIRGFYVKVISLLTSRGCRNKCAFCSESLTYGQGVRTNSPDYVIQMIHYCMDQYSFDGIYFHDNDFLLERDRAEEICRRLIRDSKSRRIKFCIQTRAGAIDPDILKLLKRAGCVKIEIGIESGVQSQIDAAGKNLMLSTAEKAVRLCHQAGIKVHGYFIGLLPGDTLDNLEQNIKMVRRLKLDSFLQSNLQLYPGTQYYQQYGKEFFETTPWEDKTVSDYYIGDHVSMVSADEQAYFERNTVKPLMKLRHRQELVLNNYPWKVAQYLIDRKIRRLI